MLHPLGTSTFPTKDNNHFSCLRKLTSIALVVSTRKNFWVGSSRRTISVPWCRKGPAVVHGSAYFGIFVGDKKPIGSMYGIFTYI